MASVMPGSMTVVSVRLSWQPPQKRDSPGAAGDPDRLVADADAELVDGDLVDRDVGRDQRRPRAVLAHRGDAEGGRALGLGQAEVLADALLAGEALDDADAVDAAGRRSRARLDS